MRNFLDRMQAGKDAAAVRRNRGLMTGAAAKGWIASKPPDGNSDDCPFDRFVAKVAEMVADHRAEFAAAMLRIRELDLTGDYLDEIPF